MESLILGSISYHERLTFVWIASGPHGEPRAAFVLDGRDYADAEQARTAVREALEQTDRRAQVADFRPARIQEHEKELDYWPSWAEFRRLLDVYGPVYSFQRPSNTPAKAVPQTVAAPVSAPRTSSYSDRHFECWGEFVVTFPAGQGPCDPVLGRTAEGYGLNGYTGEFEPDMRRALQCAHGWEDDETWPLGSEDEFIAAVEERRERLLRASCYQRRDKPEIFAAYEQAARDGRTGQSQRCPGRKSHPRGACCVVVLVEGTAETIASSYVEAGYPAWICDGRGQRVQWAGVCDALWRFRRTRTPAGSRPASAGSRPLRCGLALVPDLSRPP